MKSVLSYPVDFIHRGPIDRKNGDNFHFGPELEGTVGRAFTRSGIISIKNACLVATKIRLKTDIIPFLIEKHFSLGPDTAEEWKMNNEFDSSQQRTK